MYYLSGGKNYGFTRQERTADTNCVSLRAKLTAYVRKRTQGLAESKVGAKSDLLSLFLESPDVFTEEVIVDSLIDFVLAGTLTT